MSQPIEVLLASGFSKVYFNANLNLEAPAEPEGGRAGGHFDFDIYWGCNFQTTTSKTGVVTYTGWSCAHHDHTHEYDNQYNVTGTNMLNPSDPQKNLSLAIPATSTTPFKILLAGQKLSPGVVMKLGSNTVTDEYLSVTVVPDRSRFDRCDGGSHRRRRIPALGLTRIARRYALEHAAQHIHDANWANLQNQSACTPLTPYDPNDICRVGLVPGVTGCVTSSENKSGVVGEPAMNGALTMQIIDAATPASDIELNVAGDPAMGWKVAKTAQTRILAQLHVVLACAEQTRVTAIPAINRTHLAT
jgi:hypothetical protein